MTARIDEVMVLGTAVAKVDLAKYLRDREDVLPSDFGGLGDGVADDRAAIQAAFDRAAADGRMAVIPPGTWNVSAGVILQDGARGLLMRGVIRYTGTAPATVLTLGTGGTIRNAERTYTGLQVVRAIQSDWGSEADIGILAVNLDASVLELQLVQGFTIGLRTLGDGRGFEDTTLQLGRILNNRIGIDIHCATATAWNNAVRYDGGHFAQASGINVGQDRYGIRLSRAEGAYDNHNRHVFDAPNFELAVVEGTHRAIPFLNETNGSAVIARAMRMEACSPFAARHTAAAQDCEYEVAWSNTYQVGIDYAATATRYGSAVVNRHRAPASRHSRLLGNVPNLRAAAFRHSATEIGVDGLAAIATSTTSATTLAGLSFNGLDGNVATSRGLLLEAQKGFAFVVDCSQARDFTLAHWLVGDADGGRPLVRCFDAGMNVRPNVAGDVLASGTTMLWNSPSRAWTGGAVMADATLNRRMTLRLGSGVAYAQIGIVGFDGQIEALRLYGLPEAAPALLCGTPALPVGQREFAAEVPWDLPSLAPGATALTDVTVPGARQGDFAHAALATATRFIELDAAAWSNNTVRVMARNISAATFDFGAAALVVQVTKRRVP